MRNNDHACGSAFLGTSVGCGKAASRESFSPERRRDEPIEDAELELLWDLESAPPHAGTWAVQLNDAVASKTVGTQVPKLQVWSRQGIGPDGPTLEAHAFVHLPVAADSVFGHLYGGAFLAALGGWSGSSMSSGSSLPNSPEVEALETFAGNGNDAVRITMRNWESLQWRRLREDRGGIKTWLMRVANPAALGRTVDVSASVQKQSGPEATAIGFVLRPQNDFTSRLFLHARFSRCNFMLRAAFGKLCASKLRAFANELCKIGEAGDRPQQQCKDSVSDAPPPRGEHLVFENKSQLQAATNPLLQPKSLAFQALPPPPTATPPPPDESTFNAEQASCSKPSPTIQQNSDPPNAKVATKSLRAMRRQAARNHQKNSAPQQPQPAQILGKSGPQVESQTLPPKQAARALPRGSSAQRPHAAPVPRMVSSVKGSANAAVRGKNVLDMHEELDTAGPEFANVSLHCPSQSSYMPDPPWDSPTITQSSPRHDNSGRCPKPLLRVAPDPPWDSPFLGQTNLMEKRPGRCPNTSSYTLQPARGCAIARIKRPRRAGWAPQQCGAASNRTRTADWSPQQCGRVVTPVASQGRDASWCPSLGGDDRDGARASPFVKRTCSVQIDPLQAGSGSTRSRSSSSSSNSSSDSSSDSSSNSSFDSDSSNCTSILAAPTLPFPQPHSIQGETSPQGSNMDATPTRLGLLISDVLQAVPVAENLRESISDVLRAVPAAENLRESLLLQAVPAAESLGDALKDTLKDGTVAASIHGLAQAFRASLSEEWQRGPLGEQPSPAMTS